MGHLRLIPALVLLMAVASVGMSPEDPMVLLQESTEATATSGARELVGVGMRELDKNVDKDLWLARQAQESADAEDEEIARLLAQLEGLDAEKDAAVKEAKQREIEAKEATAAKLKETAKQKFEAVHHAIEYKTKVLEEGALNSQKEAESAVDKTKKLQEESSALMVKAKTASEEYENALTAGMTDQIKELELAAKKAMEEAQETAKAAGASSQAAKLALKHAAEVKARADKAMKMDKENKSDLVESGLRWVAGPIFDRMKTLCEQDYPTFKMEYHKIRQSPSYAPFRWDIKQACVHAREDDLEGDAPPAPTPGPAHAPPLNHAAPYPKSHTHFSVPKGGKVKKWCTTQYGAVPCSVLRKAKEAGLLGDIGVDAKSMAMIELEESGLPSGAETSFDSSPESQPTSQFPGPRYGMPGYKESHDWVNEVDIFSPVVFDSKYFSAMFGEGDMSESAAKKEWASFLDSEQAVPNCKQGTSSFSLNTYYRANEATLKEMTKDGLCGRVLKEYLRSGLFEGASTYSATAEAKFRASMSAEELDKLQGNAHAQQIKLSSTSLQAEPNCDMGHIADSTQKYAWSFWYRPESAGRVKRNVMYYGQARHASSASSKHPFGELENGPAIFETAGADGNKLQFKVSQTNDNSWGCTPNQVLSKDSAENKWNYVAFNVNQGGVQVYYNGKQVADCKNPEGKPKTFPNRRLYLSTSAKGQWEASKSYVKGLTFYPGSQLTSEIINAELQHAEQQAAVKRAELKESLMRAKSSSAAVLGESATGVVELTDDIDSRLGVQLPEDKKNKALVSSIDGSLGVASNKHLDVTKSKASSTDQLATSIDKILWSEHTGRQDRYKTGRSLSDLGKQSKAMDKLVDQSKALKKEMYTLRSKVDDAQKIIDSHKKATKTTHSEHSGALELIELEEAHPHDELVAEHEAQVQKLKDEWDQKEQGMQDEIDALRKKLEDAEVSAKEEKVASLKQVEATKAESAAEGIKKQKDADKVKEEAEKAKAEADIAQQTAQTAAAAKEAESEKKVAAAEAKAEEARVAQQKEAAKAVAAAESETKTFDELKQRAQKEIEDAKQAAEQASGAQKLAAEEAVKAKEMALNEVMRAKEEAADKVIQAESKEAMLEEREKLAEQKAVKAEEAAVAAQEEAQREADAKVSKITQEAEAEKREAVAKMSQAEAEVAQAKAAQVAAEDKADSTAQEANNAVESSQQALKKAEEEAAKAKEEAAEEISKANDDAKAQVLATKMEAEKVETESRDEAKKRLAKEKAKIQGSVDEKLKEAEQVYTEEAHKADDALAAAKTEEAKSELVAKHTTAAALEAEAKAETEESHAASLETQLQEAQNELKVAQQAADLAQSKLGTAKENVADIEGRLSAAQAAADDAKNEAEEKAKARKEAVSAEEAAAEEAIEKFAAKEKVELGAVKAETEAKKAALNTGLENVENSMEHELDAEQAATHAKALKEEASEEKSIDTALAASHAKVKSKLEDAAKAMKIASDEQHKAEVDVTRAQRDAAEKIARVRHEVKTEEANAAAKKAEAKRIIDQANTDMDKALAQTKQTLQNAKDAAALEIENVKRKAAETVKAAQHATDDAKDAQAEAHRQSEAAKEEAWHNEVTSMKDEAKQELEAAKKARKEAEDMREQVRERLQNESKEAKAEIDAKHQRAADEVAAAKEASDALDDKKQKTEEDLEKMKTNAANEAQKEADDIRNKAKEANEAEKEETDTAKPDLYQVVY